MQNRETKYYIKYIVYDSTYLLQGLAIFFIGLKDLKKKILGLG